MEQVYDFVDYAHNFKWEYGVTPLSTWQDQVGLIIGYLVVIFAIQKTPWIKVRFPTLQIIHNGMLSLFSGTILALTLYEATNVYRAAPTYKEALLDLMCDPRGSQVASVFTFYAWLFHLSKIYEFLDTLFIVMRKGHLGFLHVYHHCLTLLVTYVGLITQMSIQWMGLALNLLVHTVMYYYYMQKTRGVDLWWKKYLTKLQIGQFIYANTVMVFIWIPLDFVYDCSGSIYSCLLTLFASTTFLMLFVQFYNKSYTPKDKKKDQ
eukprot:TRINITY_DN10754_c0_g1_i1.p1 TRINITY_DN10754_c0_g1~~TRINITY_DN10754_c0_g1_i1.p1  ORF type:complete len:277 (-),score=19.56 TRINITY_DN10754_c0_g1_i1:21-809(-)